jgi:hypothetical protein
MLRFGRKPKGKEPLGGRRVGRRILEKYNGWKVDWIDVSQEKGQCRSLVNTLMNL